MKYRVSKRADKDLDEIWDYVARDSVEAADRVEKEIDEQIEFLAAMPGLGHRRTEVKSPSYHFWKVYSYVIAYRMQGRTLVVVRVVHGARDLRRMFK